MYSRTREANDPALTERIVFVVNNADSPSLLLSFIEPLKSLAGVQFSIVTEADLDSGASEPAAWRSSPAILEKTAQASD